jgi:hypothetical protein
MRQDADNKPTDLQRFFESNVQEDVDHFAERCQVTKELQKKCGKMRVNKTKTRNEQMRTTSQLICGGFDIRRAVQ